MSTKVLIAPWQLIQNTWHTFAKTWDTTVRISAWFIVVGAISAFGALIPESALNTFAILALNLLSIVIALWATIRLYQTVLAIERGETISARTTATATALIWPVLIVQALAGVATLGALILLIVPGIYVGIRLAFSQLFAIDKKTLLKKTVALKTSWELTEKKFWPIFGRVLLGGILFGIAVGIIMGVASAIVGLIAGPEFTTALASKTPPPSVAATLSFIQGLVQAALMPLAPIFMVKLYESLKGAR